jgi:hypothetical protein
MLVGRALLLLQMHTGLGRLSVRPMASCKVAAPCASICALQCDRAPLAAPHSHHSCMIAYQGNDDLAVCTVGSYGLKWMPERMMRAR